ncbi:MAG: hypothetical protein CMQ40_11115 [Gammaproteobacteria bacterium]|nr:hypothetical protein [Gammaproteobacteria bacterium]
MFSVCFLVACSPDTADLTPRAKIKVIDREAHGFSWVDPYDHLSDLESEVTRDYLRSEADYFRKSVDPWEAMIDNLAEELNSELPRTLSFPEVREGDFELLSVLVPGTQYLTFKRRNVRTGEEETLLDLPRIAGDSAYFKLGHFATSGDGRYIAYTEDREGSEKYRLVVLNLRTGFSQVVGENTDPRFSWLGSGLVCSFSESGEVALFDLTKKKKTIFSETTSGASLSIHETGSGFPMIISSTVDSTEIHLVEPGGKVVLVRKRQPGHHYRIRFYKDKVFVLSNLRSPDFELAQIVPGLGSGSDWQFLELNQEGLIFDFDVTNSGFIVHVKAGLREKIELKLLSGASKNIATTSVGQSLKLHSVKDNRFVTFWRRDLREPDRLFQFDLENSRIDFLEARYPDPRLTRQDLETKEVWFETNDGARVPMTLLYKKGSGFSRRPVFVSAYGAYGLSRPARYNPAYLPLLERGFIIVNIHVRGGGELGPDWHLAARGANKIKTFRDFIEGVKALSVQGYGDPSKVIVYGRSAGGTIAGFAANHHARMFNSVILENAFLDVVNTLRDDSYRVESDKLEWGDPGQPDVFFSQYGYSPYEQVKRQRYPNILVFASEFDGRVGVDESIKWVAKLRELSDDSGMMLLHLDEYSGHHGPTDQYMSRRREAIKYAFMFKNLGIEK